MIAPTTYGQRGYCVASSCQTDAQCPDVGDECLTGKLGGRCSGGKCDYDKAVAIANCLGKHCSFGAQWGLLMGTIS